MPAPASLKGAAKSAAQMIQGHDPKTFIDKIGERLAFERGGTRLYELLIGKFRASGSPTGEADAGTLSRFRDEESAHFKLLWECLEKIGADPTVQTPSADHTGVKAQGLLQTIADPRTTFCQALDAILIAELADNEGWRMLTDLAEGMGMRDMAAAFKQAAAEEEIHLMTIRKWTEGLILEEAGLAEAAKA
jgi:rubrerythrin